MSHAARKHPADGAQRSHYASSVASSEHSRYSTVASDNRIDGSNDGSSYKYVHTPDSDSDK